MADYRHAVVRDLNFAGYHGDAPISMGDFASIVIASPPGSAVRYATEGGWSQQDHLLANLAEQQAGLTQLPQRYERPGVEVEVETPMPVSLTGTPQWTAQSRHEFEARRARDAARGAELAATEQEVKR